MEERKRVTLISLNFHPEDTAIGLYSTQMAQFLKEKGYTVSVITAFPYYPQWKIWAKYNDKPQFYEESFEGIRIFRYRQYVPANPNFLKRIWMLLSFTYGAFRIAKRSVYTNTIVAVVPYFTSMWIGSILKRRFKAKLWVHIQDFEFDAVQQSGLSKNDGYFKRVFFKMLFKMETKLLNQADSVSTISHTMLKKLEQKTSTTTCFFPNWVDLRGFSVPLDEVHPFMKSKKFKLLYAGNVGEKQDWDFFIELLPYLSEEAYEVVVVGDGAKIDYVKDKASGYSNVKFYDPVPYEELAPLLRSADAHFLFQKTEILDSVMPSKLLGMMASGKPSLILGNMHSEVRRIFSDAGAGSYITQPHVEIATGILEDFQNEKRNSPLKYLKAREYAYTYFEKDKVLEKWLQELESLQG